jgi:hypothetical protein
MQAAGQLSSVINSDLPLLAEVVSLLGISGPFTPYEDDVDRREGHAGFEKRYRRGD